MFMIKIKFIRQIHVLYRSVKPLLQILCPSIFQFYNARLNKAHSSGIIYCIL